MTTTSTYAKTFPTARKEKPMGLTFVNLNGEKVNTESRIERKPRPVAQTEKQHKGWRVVGYSPEAIAKAKTEADKAASEWVSLSDAERAERVKGGRQGAPAVLPRQVHGQPQAKQHQPKALRYPGCRKGLQGACRKGWLAGCAGH